MHKEFRADLHCHTICSDGTDSPLALLKFAYGAGLKGLSITDHDTIDAYTPELFEKSTELGIELLPGVEISSEENGASIHILGYGFDLHSLDLIEFLKQIREVRGERNRAILELLTKRKMPITEAELKIFAPHGTIGRPHIAELMVKKGYVSSMREAFDRYLREDGLCYAPGFKQTPLEVIGHIHKAGGKAVLAHPHFIKQRSLVNRLLALPLDGIECYYAKLAKEIEAPWVKLAKERNLIATGGSDYHGIGRTQGILGSSWVGIETFHLLRSPRIA